MKKHIKSIIKEIVTVTIGILLALLINNWNENRKDRKYIKQIFSSINKELAETNQDINEKIITQESLLDTIDLYVNDNKFSLLDLIIKANGINVASVKMNSWKAISNSKIELIEYDKLSIFSNIEELKSVLKLKTATLMDYIYSNVRETGADKKEFLKLLMSDIISTEEDIRKEIRKVIK